jgi:DNA invertase Pin-like site-specific DNA recombinase
MKKAIAYTSDIILGRTGEVISREYQKEMISKFAEEKGLEIVAWFEDEVYEEDVLARPGIQKMLAYDGPCEVFLVERVWALSRKMATLNGFLKVLGQKKLAMETATYLWDCTSQMVRRQVNTGTAAPAKVVIPATVVKEPRKAAIRRPERFHFGWAFNHNNA